MATTEKRRLDIIAAVQDLATGPMRKISRSFRKGFKVGQTAVNGFRKALQGTQALLGVLAAGAAAQRGIAAFRQVSEGLRDVSNQAKATNTSASSLLTLRDAAAQNGIEFANLSAAVRTFEKNIGDARQGAKTQNETLRRLGLTTGQFVDTNKDAVEQMATVADALATVEDSTIRTNLALKLFGEDTGAALLPILGKGGAALREFASAQKQLGNTFTTEQIDAVAAMTEEFEKLRQTMAVLVRVVVTDLSPQLKQLFTDIREVIERNGPAIRNALTSMVQGLGVVFGGVIELVGLFRKSFLGIQELATAAQLSFAKLTGDRGGVIKANRELRRLFKTVEDNDRITAELSQKFANLRRELEGFGQAGGTVQRVLVTAPRLAAESVSELQRRWDEFYRGFSENTRRARDRFSDFYTEGLNAANKLVDQGLNRVGDAIGDAISRVRTAKEAFRELARSVLQDLTRIIGRLVTVNLVSSLFNSGPTSTATAETGAVFGGEVQTTMPLRRFESGGVVRRPTLALFGEGKASKGEAFVPLPDGRRIPVSLQGAGGGGNVLNFNISAMDGNDVARLLFNNRGTLRALYQRDLVGQQNVRQSVRSAVG